MMKYSDGTERAIFVRRSFKHNERLLPLLKRGWVYQERTLSPRVLYFVGEELIWECNHALDCECGAEGLENKFERIRINDMSDRSVMGANRQHGMPMALWYQIVSEYTMLNLSKQNDAFPALSGIAKVFAEKIKDEYVAGMWKRTLVSNLLWYFSEDINEEKVHGDSEPWTAPSWSWASRNWTSKAYFLPVTQELASVKSIVCQPSGADPTGKLKPTAHLTLSTKALPASLEHSKIGSGHIVRLDPNLVIGKAAEHSWYYLSCMETSYVDLDTSLLSKNAGSTDILMAQISNCTGQYQLNPYGHHISIPYQQEVRSYILLARRPQAGDGKERWIRIGLALISAYEPDKAIYGPNAETLDDEEKEGMIESLTREDICEMLEEGAAPNRAIFRRFDDLETRDVVVW
jgi:hypothetical protein